MPYRKDITFVLDDSSHILKAIEALFEEAGITNYQSFTNAKDFFENFDAGVKVCVLDYHLGGGETCIPIIKRIYEMGSHCAIIVISAGPIDLHELASIRNFGMFPYLSKMSETFNEDLILFVKKHIKIAIEEREVYEFLMNKYSLNENSRVG